jgi:two-component system NtrC family response regulator
MNEKDKILVIEDEEDIAIQLKWALSKDYDVVFAHDKDSAWEKLRREKAGVITLDLGLPPNPHDPNVGLRLLEDILKLDSRSKVIIITGNTDKENALKAVQMGAYDFYCKPIDMDELKVMLRRAFHIRRLERENLELQRKTEDGSYLENLIGTSPKMEDIFSLVRKVATNNFSVLIQGESGTGKEVIARAIHLESSRKDKPFVVINCGAIPETLLEGELFGHEKGSFTGAHIQRKGKLELAHKGTVFLDEVAELTLPLQVKLLRFLQEHTIERIGGREPIRLDVRVIAATNIDLKLAIEKGTFREDLYYRLNTLNIELPPLRERGEDILILAKFFLDKYSQDAGKKALNLSEEAIDGIYQYHWPGNIRELQNKLKRAIIMAEGSYLLPKDLDFESLPISEDRLTLRDARGRFEKNLITRILIKNDYNISHTAAELSVSRPTLHDLIKKYQINTSRC